MQPSISSPSGRDKGREVSGRDIFRPGLENFLNVPPEASSAGRARRFVRSVLEEAGVHEDLVDSAILLTSELITNGILHARSDIALTVKVLPECIRIEVVDEDPRLPSPALSSPDALSGRGLQIVQGAAQAWGIENHDSGKLIWFELPPGGH